MSSPAADLGIWVLLFCSIVFSGIGIFGLVIFPDTRGRMFTAFRATAISLGAVIAAVLTYGSVMLRDYMGGEYPALIVRTLFLAAVLAAGIRVMYGIIRDRTGRKSSGRPSDGSGTNTKDGD